VGAFFRMFEQRLSLPKIVVATRQTPEIIARCTTSGQPALRMASGCAAMGCPDRYRAGGGETSHLLPGLASLPRRAGWVAWTHVLSLKRLKDRQEADNLRSARLAPLQATSQNHAAV
jgi:hypothetical protein